jgi:mono/diheme cytochrome c family protein
MKAAGLLVVVACTAVVVAAKDTPVTTVFTEQQAEAGRSAYAKNCASCHMPYLSGNAEIPALAGPTFTGTWRTKTTKDLRDYMSAAMPYGGPSLEPDLYTVITAYVLQSNGAVAGEEKFTASTAVSIGEVIRKGSEGGN